MQYRRLTDGLNKVGTLIPANENPFKYIKDQNKDWYLSVYKYNESDKNIAEELIDSEKDGKKFKRKRGIEGITNVTTNLLAFDMDSKTDLELAKKETIAICERLDSMGIKFEDQNIAFSGGKGFSVVVEHDSELSPEEHRTIAEAIAEGLGTFDTTLYNASRIFRMECTKHNTTGLFKTQLTFEELKSMSVDSIKKIASELYEPIPNKKVTLPSKVRNLKPKKQEKKEIVKSDEVVPEIDFTKKPYYLNDLKYALQCGHIPPGMGNEGMMVLCATYKHIGMDKIDAYHQLKAVNEKRVEIYGPTAKRTKDEIWNQVISVIYSQGWKGGTYTPKQSKLLEETAAKFKINEKTSIVGVERIKDRFINFTKDINKNIIKTGIKSLDESIIITTGMMVGLLAAPSAGKTSVATTIVETLSKNDQVTLFQSMDMHDTLLYQRLLQRLSGVSIETCIRKMISSDKEYQENYNIEADANLTEAFDKVNEVFKNVEFNFTRGCTIESIEEDIKICKNKHGDKLKVVVIDYLEKVRGPYSDATANSGFVASRLSDLASTYDVAIILLLQPQKSAGDPSEELLSMRKVKGASVIEQDCRVILTMWRPGFNPQNSSDDRYVSIAVVKNNMGPITQLDFVWDGLKGHLIEMKQADRSHLEALLEEKKAAKEEDKKSGWDI